MIYKLVISILISFIICLLLCLIGIPILKKIKVGQPVLKYVEKHKNKNGTPTMGGIFFVFSLLLVFLSLYALKKANTNPHTQIIAPNILIALPPNSLYQF